MTTQTFVAQLNNQTVTLRMGSVVVPNVRTSAIIVPNVKVTGGVAGRPGVDGLDGTAAVTDHINDSTPHVVYDDMNDLTLIFENGLV